MAFERLRALLSCTRPAPREITPAATGSTTTTPSAWSQPIPAASTTPSISRQPAAPGGTVTAPRTEATGSAWQRLKAAVLEVAFATAAVIVALAALSVPLTWLLVGGVALGIGIARCMTGFVNWQTQRDEQALSALYAS